MDRGSITRLLQEIHAGAPGAEERLFDRIYDELKTMASRRTAKERPAPADGGATDLVNDAYARLAGEQFEDRRHLFFAYARAMRQILIEAVRRRRAHKRGGHAAQVAIDPAEVAMSASEPSAALDAEEVDGHLERLRIESPREADVVMLRFFGGLRDADIAEVLDIDARTVRRDWASAKKRIAGWMRP